MKGDMIDIFATLVMIGCVTGLALFLRAYFISYSGGVETPIENLESVQAAYQVESCLVGLGEEEYITSDLLDEKNGEFIGKLCNITYPPIYAKIKDIENGKTWEFKRPTTIEALEALYKSYEIISKVPTTNLWVWEKIKTIWYRKRQTSKPKHEIFVPILYEKKSYFTDDESIFESWKYYVIVFSKKDGNLNLDIYPIERYEGEISSLRTVQIKGEKEGGESQMSDLATEMKNLQKGSEKRIIFYQELRRHITFKELKEYFDGYISVNLYKKEIHGGRLYVEV